MAHQFECGFRWKKFRSFENSGWVDIKPLTILLGANNVGKTSLLAPLLLMNQTISSRDTETPLITRGPLFDAGGYEDLIFGRIEGQVLSLGFRFHHHSTGKIDASLDRTPPGSIELEFRKYLDRGLGLKSCEINDVYGRTLARIARDDGGRFRLTEFLNNKDLEKSLLRPKEIQSIAASSPTNFLFSPTRVLHSFHEQFRTASGDAARTEKMSPTFSKFMSTIGFTFEQVREFFNLLSYIGPLRDRPRRYYERSAEVPKSVGAQAENAANLVRSRLSDISDELNGWLRHFEFGESLHVQDSLDSEIFSLRIFEKEIGKEINIADLGFGVSQVLPLIIQTLCGQPDSLTVAEQPEVHLNPRLQMRLADLFVKMTENDQRVIVETHSEHFLLRLRRLIAEGKISAESVVVYFVERSMGVSSLRTIPIDKMGGIDPECWPKGFFEDSLSEALALAAAGVRS